MWATVICSDEPRYSGDSHSLIQALKETQANNGETYIHTSTIQLKDQSKSLFFYFQDL